jgi:anaphase-promoting complex subunit 5
LFGDGESHAIRVLVRSTNYFQGDSVARAFEYMYQSSHLNIKENICNYGSQMLLQSTLYSRLGMPHMADVHCELLLDCYSQSCPVDERIRAIGRRALILSQSGRYDDAIATLDSIDFAVHRSLKFHQYLVLCTGVIKLKQAIRRYIFPPSSMYDSQYSQQTELTG